MKPPAWILSICALVTACAGPAEPAASSPSPSEAPAAASPGASATASPDPSLAANQVVVSGRANIFGAGRDDAPDPGGGGGGELPPVWALPAGERMVVRFPSVTGMINPIATGNSPTRPNGPEGDGHGPLDIESHEGISGIVHGGNGMFLVGVFLTDEPPAGEAPARLDFTDGEDFARLEPEIGQVFLIGDGVGREYLAPEGATRLFLGFADGAAYHGPPGYYGNNSGELVVTIEEDAA